MVAAALQLGRELQLSEDGPGAEAQHEIEEDDRCRVYKRAHTRFGICLPSWRSHAPSDALRPRAAATREVGASIG